MINDGGPLIPQGGGTVVPAWRSNRCRANMKAGEGGVWWLDGFPAAARIDSIASAMATSWCCCCSCAEGAVAGNSR